MTDGVLSEDDMPRPGRWGILAALVALTLAVGALGGLVTAPRIATWYAHLAKPPFVPPSWVFAPVWTALYLAMAVAAWRVARTPPGPARRRALVLFFVQLGLNALWSPAFFGARSPLLGLVVIVPLWLAILATLRAFARLDRLAGLLFWPYLAWVSFASLLVVAILILNGPGL